MTQINTDWPASPRHAARRRGAIDKALTTDLFKALCDPTRVRLLACLAKCGRSCSVSEIAACTSVDLSVVSRHLAILARAGVIASEKKGRIVLYRVCYEHLSASLRAAADSIDACCPGRSGGGNGNCCTTR